MSGLTFFMNFSTFNYQLLSPFLQKHRHNRLSNIL